MHTEKDGLNAYLLRMACSHLGDRSKFKAKDDFGMHDEAHKMFQLGNNTAADIWFPARQPFSCQQIFPTLIPIQQRTDDFHVDNHLVAHTWSQFWLLFSSRQMACNHSAAYRYAPSWQPCCSGQMLSNLATVQQHVYEFHIGNHDKACAC